MYIKERILMPSSQKLSEASIQTALVQGYITSKEARQMLMLYVHKANSSPRPQKPSQSHHRKQ